MNLGALEVQIFVSLSLVLGAILVAFVCDFLKGNNESLRERNIELRVRQEERERYQEAMAHRAPRAIEAPAPRETPVVAEAPSRQASEHPPEHPVEKPSEAALWAKHEELDEAEEIASKIRGDVQTERPWEETLDQESEKEPELERPVIEEPVPAVPPPAMHAKVTPIDRLALERTSAREAMRLAEELADAARVTANSLDDFREESEEVSELAEEIEDVAQAVEEAADQSPALPVEETEQILKEEEPVELSLPRGMITAEKFKELSVGAEKFRGAVVAIGLNGRNGATEDARQAEMLMESLLSQESLGCRIADDEYVLVFPGEDGAAGQRRFQQISQRLWDHQIRSVASGSITFSWGAMETSRMSLSATVASARERLEQTRRHRERAPSQIENFRLIRG